MRERLATLASIIARRRDWMTLGRAYRLTDRSKER